MKKTSWAAQLVRVTDKGAQAFRDGLPISANPYLKGERGHGIRSPGGNLQKQRADYWEHGWKVAAGIPTEEI